MGDKEIRVPPQNLEAEKAVLGALLIDEEAIGDVLEVLDASFFYEPGHQKIFEAVRTLYKARRNVDIITLSDQLSADGALEVVGGSAYLTELVEAVPTAANVLYHAEIVKDKGIKRQLIKQATEIVARSFEPETHVDGLLDDAQRLIFDITGAREKQKAVLAGDIVKGAINTIESLYERKQNVTGISTGYYIFDKMTSGLQRSDLIIIAGRPSMGKSAFAACIAEHVAFEQKLPVAFYSIEMAKEQVVMRMLCSQARVDASKVRTGMLAASEWPLLTGAANKINNAPFWIDDSPILSPIDLRTKARRLKAKADIGLIIVDYLQLMRGSDQRVESRQQEVSEISRSLKAIARELKVPVIAISQLSRAAEADKDARPRLSHLRESGAIEQDADVVCLLYREDYYNPKPENMGMAEVIIAKQRNGPTGTVKLKFTKEFVRFDNLELAHQEE